MTNSALESQTHNKYYPEMRRHSFRTCRAHARPCTRPRLRGNLHQIRRRQAILRAHTPKVCVGSSMLLLPFVDGTRGVANGVSAAAAQAGTPGRNVRAIVWPRILFRGIMSATARLHDRCGSAFVRACIVFAMALHGCSCHGPAWL